MIERRGFDESVRELVGIVLKERQAALTASGLRTTVDIRKWRSEDDAENSELRITFWRGDTFIDGVENFIVRDGRPVASLAEFKPWLVQAIGEVLAENHES